MAKKNQVQQIVEGKREAERVEEEANSFDEERMYLLRRDASRRYLLVNNDA